MDRLTAKIYSTYDLKGAIDTTCADVCRNNTGCEACLIQKAIDKLAHYEILEEQGRLIVLPCKIGTPVWHVVTDGWDYEVVEDVVTGFIVDENGVKRMCCDDYNFSVARIGKSVFFTKAEVEKALAEMEK